MGNPSQIAAKVAKAVFDRPLIMNVFRAYVVEAIFDEALSPAWSWCSIDYAGWDFENAEGVRLEVKQSAARQSWQSAKPSRASFDIRARTGRYEGPNWISEPGRNADIYVFAWHPVSDDTADHRDPMQWEFFVVPSRGLPDAKSIGLSRLRTLASPLRFGELGNSVDNVVIDMKANIDRAAC